MLSVSLTGSLDAVSFTFPVIGYKICNPYKKAMKINHYKTLGITLCISLVIMYSVMFLNVDDASHIHLSITRMYMSVLMVAPMTVLMLLMMKHMFMSMRLNMIIHAMSILVFIVVLYLLRSQTLIGDEQYMRAMIPHHSSAILTSKHAAITDPEVKELSKKIIESQEEEIAQMKSLLEKLDR